MTSTKHRRRLVKLQDLNVVTACLLKRQDLNVVAAPQTPRPQSTLLSILKASLKPTLSKLLGPLSIIVIPGGIKVSRTWQSQCTRKILVKCFKIDVVDFPSVVAYKYRERVGTADLAPFWTSENNPKNGFHKPGLEKPTERVAETRSKQRSAPGEKQKNI
ncbi:hypothetical protein B0H16DRAFT_1461369 [Mycena metata]|uniref:Uncharacterized protein n=1 Tax=Mycena metata TaxID=1033252 RepID=A0AAD7N6W3_9AGAR|nr:hypothetical protein B0H16DRAFT_1461369 [Mycena metata]